MRVIIEREGVYEDDPVIAVYLDSGKEVGRYCIADDPRAEAGEMRKMLRLAAGEAIVDERQRIVRIIRERRWLDTGPPRSEEAREYRNGYRDALGELLEVLDEDPAIRPEPK